MSEDTLIKFDGKDVACTTAACARDTKFSEFLQTLAANFMSGDKSMEETFKDTKMQFAVGQIGNGLPKLPVVEMNDVQAQSVGNAAALAAGGHSV